jgi:hypothetical protein
VKQDKDKETEDLDQEEGLEEGNEDENDQAQANKDNFTTELYSPAVQDSEMTCVDERLLKLTLA